MDNGMSLLSVKVGTSLKRAIQYSWDDMKIDHWCAELQANPTLTAEQIFFLQTLRSVNDNSLPIPSAYIDYLLHVQQMDGSWSIAPYHPGDVSTSVEAYLALRIAGVASDSKALVKAKAFILQAGGVAKVRVFTRFYLAQFGLFPWDAVPSLPTELILLPSWCPVNIYGMASWARSTVVPLAVVSHHRPIHALPNGLSPNNDFLDELWINPINKEVPLGCPALDPLSADSPLSYVFSVLNKTLGVVNGLRGTPWLRGYSLHFGIQALLLEGWPIDSDVIQRGLQAINRFHWQDADGLRLQSCVSPVWDTGLMIRGLCDAGVDREDKRLISTVHWLQEKQLRAPKGDWRVYRPHVPQGGFPFEYHNTWYPDVDTTAASVMALLDHDPQVVERQSVIAAVQWILGMQNSDGGWGAFDVENNRQWLNESPFADMKSLCDPSSADCTGHMLELMGRIRRISNRGQGVVDQQLLQSMQRASEQGIRFIAGCQESFGGWYGRWGVNYIYGTSHVLCGLDFFEELEESPSTVELREAVKTMRRSATAWLKQIQNDDGGWGESLHSYSDPARWAGVGASTPSQTAWAIMALLTTGDTGDSAMMTGVEYLIRTQTDKHPSSLDDGSATWPEDHYTGTGFPNFFYIGYRLYRHYFPLVALGRFATRLKISKSDL